MIMAPRGPRRVLCVVVLITPAWPTGLGCAPLATRPAMCARSATSTAPASAAISAKAGKSIPRTIDFPAFAEIAAEAGAVLVADLAHIAGLVARGAHPSPVGHAGVIRTTTHKTLRGPRGAMIMTTAEHASRVDKAVFPGLQGGPHNHTTAAIAVALREAAQPAFGTYVRQVLANAQALAAALLERGYALISGGTDNHLIRISLTPQA